MLNEETPYYLSNGRRITSPGTRLSIASPWSRQVIGSTLAPTLDDVPQILENAGKSVRETRMLSTTQRSQILTRLAALASENRTRLAECICAETGKTLKDCNAEVTRAIATLELSAVAATSLIPRRFPTGSTDPDERDIWGIPTPAGVVAAIPAFNYPLVIACHKLGPAIAAGCPIVLKPSEKTPLTTLLLAELTLETGWPPAAISVLPGDRAIGHAIITHSAVRVVSFTGSTTVGKEIAKSVQMASAVLELGSCAPTIALADADVDRVAERVVQGGFVANGQSCISVQRVLVAQTIYDAVLTKLTSAVQKLRTGDPREDSTDIGPVIDRKSALRISDLIEDAVAKGATILTGGEISGTVVAPTVVAGLTSDMRLSSEEVFGPVIAVGSFKTVEEAIELANDTPFGLQAGVFTNAPELAREFLDELDFGGIHFNEISTFRLDGMPYGGVKDSGIGKEGPIYAAEHMSVFKIVTGFDGEFAR